MGIRRRMMFGALALLLSLGGALQTSAQAAGSDIPDGAIDGASLSYLQESGEDPLAPIYGFVVFAFEDDDAATAAMDDVPRRFSDSLTEDEIAELVELSADDIDGLDDLGDEARAWRVAFGEDVGNLSMSLLAVRDGDILHVWTSFILDFSFAFDDDAAGDGESPAVTTSVDPLAGATDLVAIASGWFGGDKPDDGDLIDQLPTVDALPDGYVEADRAESLDEFEDDSDGGDGGDGATLFELAV